ncbi:hypothetical protein BB559_001381 [Furculomyces boomerangus]|uniref:Uncharacterized protein n=2 Tax=Harpellales TaxID=61421 RepID=A0A2T9Z287_9FUNG|nr:hypothetical protein BB559_001381 [Furculomyces boomerangus]PVZ98535.1 hypothetical protein BB558_005444 [Smittium angustum]
MIKTILFAGLFALTSSGQNPANVVMLGLSILKGCSNVDVQSMNNCIKDRFNENGFGQYFNEIECNDICDNNSDVYAACMRKCYIEGLRDILENGGGTENTNRSSDKPDNESKNTSTGVGNSSKTDNGSGPTQTDNGSGSTQTGNGSGSSQNNSAGFPKIPKFVIGSISLFSALLYSFL